MRGRIPAVDEIESVMHQLGTAFAAGLTKPGSMQASLIAYGHQSQTYDVAGNAASIGRWDASSGTDVYALMNRLRAVTGVDGPFLVELTGSPAGGYEVSYHAGSGSSELPELEPIVVRDAGYRLPDHPRPGMVRPAATVNNGRPTDPDVLAEVRDLVAQFIAEHTRLRGTPPEFAPGYSEAEILAAEEQLGVRLPEDIRALYRVIHDDNGESGLLGRFSPAPLEQILTWYHEGDPGSYGWNDELFEYTPVVFETYPHGHVRRVSRSDWWVTFAPDYGMNYAVVDLDPAASGEYGQILMFGRDVLGPIVYVAPSVRHLMREVVASMRGPAPDDEAYWPDPPDHEWFVDLGDSDLAGMVAAVADPSVIQLVHLRQADRLRLTDLAGLPQLRAIRIVDGRQKAAHVDLSIPPGLPVEQVDVTAEHFDPARLAGTPTLRYVTLAGNTAPVRVAALAALPDLVRLDLAGAAVADVAAVAAFPALRVLTLDATQWQELLGTGWTPQRLAAARLGGRGGVAAAAEWQTAICGADQPTVQHRTIRGPR
jgi:cell wall assembly regulator SMI1